MSLKNILFFLLLVLFNNITSAQKRTLYVDNFNEILGDYNKEKQLLTFSKQNKFTSLILYELHLVRKRIPISDPKKIKILANFISLAKKKYNIKIIATGENSDIFINYIHKYNKTRKNNFEQFDSYNLEYEYWHKTNSAIGGYYCENYLRKNSIPCTIEGSFNYYLETISILTLLKEEIDFPLNLETYITNFTKKQILRLKKYNLKYRISAYADDVHLSSHEINKELNTLIECDCLKEISVIFSAETLFMGGFLKYNSLQKTENEFKEYVKKYNNINFIGFTYFKYTDLIKSVDFEKTRRTGEKPKY